MSYATEKTSVWVGLKMCGCCVAVVVDDPMVPRKDIEKSKREFLKDGLSVVHASWQQWQETYLPAMKSDCPHETAVEAK